MSRSDAGEHDEPIDVEYQPAERVIERSGGVSFGAAFLLALVAAGAGAAGGALAPRVPEVDALLDKAIPDQAGATADTQLEQLATSEADLKQRLEAIETVMNQPLAETASGGSADTAARVFALQASLQSLQTDLQSMPSTTEVRALVTEVQRVQEELPSIAAESRQAAEAARAAFAMAAAMEASQKSGPFEESLASLQALLPDDENVRALEPLARTGAPTVRELRDRFEAIDASILRAARVAQAGTGFWGRINAALADFVIVRQTGQSEADTPDGVVERASDRLAAEDLRGAVEALNQLSGPARQSADAWLADAQRRLEIDERLSAVRTELSRRG